MPMATPRHDSVPSHLPLIVSAVAGFVFALGLGLAGMTQADKVIAFLNLAGDWDPSLAVVMTTALVVYAPAYRLYQRRRTPMLGGDCQVPTHVQLDRPLLVGAAIFGVGWALGGYCPGPGVVAVMAGPSTAWLFVAAMALGMLGHAKLMRQLERQL